MNIDNACQTQGNFHLKNHQLKDEGTHLDRTQFLGTHLALHQFLVDPIHKIAYCPNAKVRRFVKEKTLMKFFELFKSHKYFLIDKSPKKYLD